jgi:citrate lyase subunit beta/citryl-CoA lyase
VTIAVPPGPAWLFVPGDRPDRWAKAAERADAVVVDLENAVAPTDKGRARDAVADVLAHVRADRLVVRLNAIDTSWYGDDIVAARAAGVNTVMLPKVRSRADIERAHADLPGVGVIALCETATSILDARDVASTAGCTAIMWGGEDLAVDLGGTTSHAEDGELAPAMAFARTQLQYAARAAQVAAIDAPVLRVDRPDWVTGEARAAAAMGYHAKSCIHPDHVRLIRSAFAPALDEVVRAAAVVAAADELLADVGGTEVPVFVLDGQMIDHPVVALARTVLARAQH